VQAIKLVHFFFRSKFTPARSIHSGPNGGSLFVGQPVHAAAARFYFAGDVGEFFLILLRSGLNPFQ
jgi:hypothetical protein